MGRQRMITVGAGVVAVVAIGVWLAGGRPPAYGDLEAVAVRPDTARDPRYALERLTLTSSRGREVACTLRRPLPAGPPRTETAILLFGGIGTGRRAALLVDGAHRAVILSCDYPWADPSRAGWPVLLARLPSIRGEVLATPRALEMAATALLSRPEVDTARLTAVGASLAVPFVSSWAASDRRVSAVALIYGGGDLRALFDANLGRRIRSGFLRRVASRIAAAALSDLDPARTVGGISPRPLLLVGSREDERVPRASTEALSRAARPPVTERWFDGRHMMPRDTALLRGITDSTVAWLAEAVTPLSPGARSRDLPR